MTRPSGRLQALQNDILEDIARGEPLIACMERLCHRAEAISPGVICSVVAIDNQCCLQPLASPSLPPHYVGAIKGVPAGPEVGSCGTAIFRGEPVEVTDIATDPLWRAYTDLALPLGLRACWSTPIKARDGRVVGAFAFYFRAARRPRTLERRIVATCVHLCAIAIEHDEVRTRNHRLAYFDTLTGLPNRSQFNSAIAEMSAAGRRYGLMLIDIDHLKTVNDTLGHAAGDALIAVVGRRLDVALAGCLTCRIGGDEFAVLVPDCREPARMRAFASAAMAAVAVPFDHDGHSLVPGITIGGVIAGEDGQDTVTLRQNADLALYHAKETRRGRYVRFRRQLRSAMMHRIRTRRDVAGALGDDRIIPYYQPVIRLDTNEVVGLEALARMRLDDGRIIAAGEFQDALRDPKIAHRTTTQMLTAVAADMAEWRASGLNFQHVAVNVTSADFQKGDLVQRATRTLEKAGVPLQQLVIEVTEQVFMGGRKDGVARTMEALRANGSPVALDDFGTGFASLTHLLDFPIDIIKIDRSFVGSIDSGARSEIIIEALLTMTRRLGMKIVAEGIEKQAQAERLSEMGCGLGQGYLYSPPVPASIIREWLQRFAQPIQAPVPTRGLVANAA
ncbi:putative bifunctional diguanylate cyclase/phosphodiesterase [Bosea sp. Root670]|uniref:putative bifunctional diguanylate cyclase/phosphodiesterase n=1 Tax=Bosea sp. Root670 TaxID=1736583 RepID=UPI000A4ADA6D|nr:EAL domain-containing protein [Bosea sp. Root670]